MVSEAQSSVSVEVFEKQGSMGKQHRKKTISMVVPQGHVIDLLLVGVFEENARLLQWLVQRDQSNFCSLFNIINSNYGRPKHTRNGRTSSKTETSTSRTSKI